VGTRACRADIGGGRAVSLDDVGDPAGVPVLYLHGTPSSRLARPPDDEQLAALGVRLLAVDRPGYGGSDGLPPGAPWVEAFAADVAAVLAAVGVGRCRVLASSGGALAGLALAANLSAQVDVLGIVGGIVPRQAFDNSEVRAAAGDLLATLELADALPPGELGRTVAPLLAPFPCDRALALEHQDEHRHAVNTRELATVPRGAERMADAMVEAVRAGLAGVVADVEAQARPLDVDLSDVRCPVRLWYGRDDPVTPPAFGEWYARRLPDATLEIVDGAAHFLLFTRWADIVGALAAADGA
jgi:pimeloyl-ACP methyl ester carboxylesterase